MNNIKPVIKWSGSKRPIAQNIVDTMPKKIDTYYEPFCGGASVTRRLLDNIDVENIFVNKIVCSDINNDLITLWNEIKNNPTQVAEHYDKLWNELYSIKSKGKKKEYFNKIRERLNNEHNPLDFMFIMRTCTNGMPRYNKDGEFNNSFHITRDGIMPDKLFCIITEWSYVLNKHNVEFICQSYENIIPTENDYCFFDPPYANTKGMYFGGFNNIDFFHFLEGLKCPYSLTYDGKSGNVDNTYKVPDNLYDKHVYLKSGNSSFKRTIGKSKDSIVYESLYIKD